MQAPVEQRWSPYADNGGTCMGVAGEDFVVVAADTRLSQGYSIHTRNCSKVTQLTDKCVIASCGMKSDAITLHKHLKARMARLLLRQPSVTAIAQMLSTTLYYKRFFPYYTFNVLCGVDDEGKGAVHGMELMRSLGNYDVLHQLMFATILLHWNLYAPLPPSQRVSAEEWLEISAGILPEHMERSEVDLKQVQLLIYKVISHNFFPQLEIWKPRSSSSKKQALEPSASTWARIVVGFPSLALTGAQRVENYRHLRSILSESTGPGSTCMASPSPSREGPTPVPVRARAAPMSMGFGLEEPDDHLYGFHESAGPGPVGGRVWLALHGAFLFLYAFMRVADLVVKSDAQTLLLTLLPSLSTGTFLSSPTAAKPGLQVVFLLPDGRWQVLEVPRFQVQVSDKKQLELVGVALSEQCIDGPAVGEWNSASPINREAETDSLQGLGDEGTMELASLMERKSRLMASPLQWSSLGLQHNAICSSGAVAFAGALPHCPQLRELLLYSNCIGPEGAAAICHALPDTGQCSRQPLIPRETSPINCWKGFMILHGESLKSENFAERCAHLAFERYFASCGAHALSARGQVVLAAILAYDLTNDANLWIVDAVYYNNLVALNGAVSHSGDEVTGQASDFDEMVWAVFAKLPPQVKMLLFVVAACGDSALRDAANATVHVVQEFHGHTVLRFPCEKSRADVDVIVLMEKDNQGKWWLYQVDEPAEHGEHFLDILEPTIGDIIRRRIDNAPKFQRVTFQMKKGTAVDLPKNALKRLNFSVMATIKAKVRKEIDLDISAVFTDKEQHEGRCLGACWHDQLELFGFQHSGDRDADEDMNVDLLQVPAKVHSVYIIVDLVAPNYKEVSFRDITYASCMANDQNCKTLASFTLESDKDDCNGMPGLILCRLVRNSSKRWELEEALPTILKLYDPAKNAVEEAVPVDATTAASRRKSRAEYRGTLASMNDCGSE
eukprot:g31993.t1